MTYKNEEGRGISRRVRILQLSTSQLRQRHSGSLIPRAVAPAVQCPHLVIFRPAASPALSLPATSGTVSPALSPSQFRQRPSVSVRLSPITVCSSSDTLSASSSLPPSSITYQLSRPVSCASGTVSVSGSLPSSSAMFCSSASGTVSPALSANLFLLLLLLLPPPPLPLLLLTPTNETTHTLLPRMLVLHRSVLLTSTVKV